MPFLKFSNVSGNRSLTVAALIGAATVRERSLRSAASNECQRSRIADDENRDNESQRIKTPRRPGEGPEADRPRHGFGARQNLDARLQGPARRHRLQPEAWI